MRLFKDRLEAAHELGRLLAHLRTEDPVVLGLANGGVPMAEIIAGMLDAPLDVLLIERLSAPRKPEHIVGAVDEHGRISLIKATARWHQLTNRELVEPAREAFRELQRRRAEIRRVLPEFDVRNRTVVIVSQGVTSGAKMLGAVASVRDRGARRIIAAAPAGSGEAAWQLHDAADIVVIPHRPARLNEVATYYENYAPVTNEIVREIVERWVATRPAESPGVITLVHKVPNAQGQLLCCDLDLPPGMTRGSGPYPAVVFAHGYESDGRNPRSVPISRRLAKRGIIGVRLHFTGHGRSEGRLEDATDEQMADDLRRIVASVGSMHEVDASSIGLAGSGSGAALALRLAEECPSVIRTVVARGPMDGHEITIAPRVKAPSLFIYGDGDLTFAEAVKRLRPAIPSQHQIVEIPDASRLFGDEISRELLQGATVDWLADHLATIPVPTEPAEVPEPS